VTSTREGIGEWVLLSYRLPREPSTPRIAVWRKLRRLGVAQISDGLVALPAGARTREQLEWVSEEVIDARGTAAIWLAMPATRAQEDQLARAMAAARAAEYQALITAAEEAAASPVRIRQLGPLRSAGSATSSGPSSDATTFPPPNATRPRPPCKDWLPGRPATRAR